jgi:hypothetical protein
LHQGFAQYAHRLPVYVRNEWAKIEGRFRTFNYVEDSLQIYSLIAHAVQKLRSPVLTSAIAKAIKPYIRPTKNIPGLGSLGSTKEVERLLENTFPLNPITLYVLPRLSARVAQNERTLFHFLLGQESDCLFPIIEHSANAQHLVSVAHLFDYFSDVMQRDTGVGGVYRRYGEIVTALGHRSGGQIFTFDSAEKPHCGSFVYVDRCGATNDFSLWLVFAVMGIESPALRRAHPLHFHLEG